MAIHLTAQVSIALRWETLNKPVFLALSDVHNGQCQSPSGTSLKGGSRHFRWCAPLLPHVSHRSKSSSSVELLPHLIHAASSSSTSTISPACHTKSSSISAILTAHHTNRNMLTDVNYVLLAKKNQEISLFSKARIAKHSNTLLLVRNFFWVWLCECNLHVTLRRAAGNRAFSEGMHSVFPVKTNISSMTIHEDPLLSHGIILLSMIMLQNACNCRWCRLTERDCKSLHLNQRYHSRGLLGAEDVLQLLIIPCLGLLIIEQVLRLAVQAQISATVFHVF